MEARLDHPIFDPVRPWVEGLKDFSLESFNLLAEKSKLRTESGKPIRFVSPASADPYYELHLFETGCVQTRAGNWHDRFNALAWLAFPRTKARINAMHAAQIPREREQSGGRRGRLRDLLTIFDEGGAIVECANPELEEMIREFRWKDLFSENRARVLLGLRVHVLGHAVLEQALQPYPGITCKIIFADPARDLDAQAAAWLGAKGRTPGDLPPLPVFGYPGWFPGNDRAEFYADERYFRPFKREPPTRQRCSAVKSVPGAGQAAAASQDVEESPGSTERDAG